MNIFVLDQDPIKAAQYLCDKHVIKMAIESAQILCTAIHLRLELNDTIPGLYSPTHVKHPSVLWAGENKDNFEWLAEHAKAICKEYTFRYGKTHGSEQIVDKATIYSPLFDMTGGRSTFAEAMPDICATINPADDDVVFDYRCYYWFFKRGLATWRNREPPSWWTLLEEEVKLGRGYIASINKAGNNFTS